MLRVTTWFVPVSVTFCCIPSVASNAKSHDCVPMLWNGNATRHENVESHANELAQVKTLSHACVTSQVETQVAHVGPVGQVAHVAPLEPFDPAGQVGPSHWIPYL